ncbi:MAG: TerB family tellurite resistance protein [Sandaracinaceae bacterium]|nr:TerB family tellurite resistance protein [Sandaracinaceae bacterium]MCC6877041.1 TerB family tellurite resistance protein [Sandaracinaceae bacterium]
MDERVARCVLVAKVLAADGIMTEHERAFLENAMDASGLSEEERRRVRDLEGWDQAEAQIAALSEAERRAFMDSLVNAVLADGKVSPHEMQTIEKLAAALRLP